MLMVLNLHSFWGYNHGSGIWQALDFFRESTSICAVDCFILISGYFGIRWKFKSFFNLVFQLFFYSVGIYLVVVGLGIVDWSVKEFVARFACLFTRSWGFAITFVLLYLCSPLLNALAEKSTSRELLMFIGVFFLTINFISVPRHAFFTYALVYLIGRFLRKIDVAEIKFPAGKAYWIVTLFIFVLVYFLIFKTLHVTKSGMVTKWPLGLFGYDYAAPLVIAQAVCLFLFFAKLRFNNNIVNWCAASSFAIYLIHMHPTIKKIGYQAYTKALYDLPALQHIVVLIVFLVSVFFTCILIDKVRIAVFNVCYGIVEHIVRLIPNKWYRMENYLPKSLVVLMSR